MSSEPAPVRAESNTKYEPGYGEEPDTAAPPGSFDDLEGGDDVDVKDAERDGEYHGRHDENPTNGSDEPLQMKEDG